MRDRKTIGLLTASALMSAIGIWLLLPRPQPSAQSSARPALVMEGAAATTGELPREATANSPAESQPPADTAANGPTISSIITSSYFDNAAMVDQLLVLLPGLSEDEQAEAAHHIAHLSADEDVSKWSDALVAGTLPAPATEILFAELCNRPKEIAWPILAAIADNPAHLHRKDSVAMLSLLTGTPAAHATWSQLVAPSLAGHARDNRFGMQ